MKSYFDAATTLPYAGRIARLREAEKLAGTTKPVPFERLPENVLAVMEDAMLPKARDAANRPGSGFLREHEERDRTGRMIATYEGDPGVWLKPFKAPAYYATINKGCGHHKETISVPNGSHATTARNGFGNGA